MKPVKVRPPLKWIGGKTQLLPELLARVPAKYGTYHEPFVGGGALFFALQPERAWLNDSNEELISLYLELQDDVDGVIAALKSGHFVNDPESFYAIRGTRAGAGAFDAARTIYLNKTCFNGLYRVNSSGRFNSPFGKYKNPTICDEANLRAVAKVLQSAELSAQDYTSILEIAKPDDFVYFDPPYIPLTKTSSFTAYTPGKFGLHEHMVLRDLAIALKKRGVHVLLSNSASPITEELYAGHGFVLEPVQARRSVNANGKGRGAIKEYLIR